jgi:hypothetical protein
MYKINLKPLWLLSFLCSYPPSSFIVAVLQGNVAC